MLIDVDRNKFAGISKKEAESNQVPTGSLIPRPFSTCNIEKLGKGLGTRLPTGAEIHCIIFMAASATQNSVN